MLNPREDLVLIQIAPAKTMIGRLHVPDEAKQRPAMGWVIAAGPGKQKACLGCGLPHIVCPMPTVGEFVLFPENAGTPLGDGAYKLLRATDLHGYDPDLFGQAPKIEEKAEVPVQ